MSKHIWVFNNGFTEQPVKDEDPKEDGWIHYVEFSEYEKLKSEKLERAIAVLRAAEIILKESYPSGSMLEKIIHQTKIDGIKFAIECLEEVSK